MKILIVVAHLRPNSLSHTVVRLFNETITTHDREVDNLDLHAEEFDPRMTISDEPDWGASANNILLP